MRRQEQEQSERRRAEILLLNKAKRDILSKEELQELMRHGCTIGVGNGESYNHKKKLIEFSTILQFQQLHEKRPPRYERDVEYVQPTS